MQSKWTTKVLLGTRKEDNVKIFLQPPSWDCDWYWGLGYLGNTNEHYPLSSYANGSNISMYDALSNDYDLNPLVKLYLWEFCETFTSLYTLRKMADLSHRGGSNITSTIDTQDVLKSPNLANKINSELIPCLLDYIYDLITGKKIKDVIGDFVFTTEGYLIAPENKKYKLVNSSEYSLSKREYVEKILYELPSSVLSKYSRLTEDEIVALQQCLHSYLASKTLVHCMADWSGLLDCVEVPSIKVGNYYLFEV